MITGWLNGALGAAVCVSSLRRRTHPRAESDQRPPADLRESGASQHRAAVQARPLGGAGRGGACSWDQVTPLGRTRQEVPVGASLTFRSPTLETAFGGPQGQVKTGGTAVDGRLSFVIAADSLDGDFWAAGFLDHVSTTEELAIGMNGSAIVSSTGFTMPMNGLIQYRKGSVFLNCDAPDHSLRFQPR